MSAFVVFLWALVTALATGLGALPFLFVRRMSRRWLGISNAIAAGLMVAASGGLVLEGLVYGIARVVAGMVLGILFIRYGHGRLAHRPALELGALRGADAVKALLIVGVMTVHSAAEGIGIGVSFGGDGTLGLFITLAIAVHNVPEGLAISLVLVPRGVAVGRAAGWSVFSSLPQPLLAVPAFLFVRAFEPVLPVGLGFAAGAMVWMVLADLVPDARRDAPDGVVLAVALASAAALAALQLTLRG